MESKKISEIEFISLMASLMALAALSIDAMLPGLDVISESIGTTDPKDNQFLITIIVLGLGIGQLVSGALSDSIGRKPVMYIGCSIFAVASVICVFANNFEIMIFGRLLQGIGLSAPRSVSMAIIRDKYSGNLMAKVMSYITVIFILAPVIAPTFGKVLLDSLGWQSIFYSQLIFGVLVTVWLWKRQPETLKEEDKKGMDWKLFRDGIKEFFKYRKAVIYTIISGIISAPFLAYISASQQIFSQQYNLGDIYPYIFSGLALSIGVATFLNGMFVMKHGMKRMATIPIYSMFIISVVYIMLYWNTLNPNSIVFIGFLALILFSIGFIFGNLNAMAMEPIGHIAGIGASIIGFLSTLVSVPVAAIIGQFVEETALPIFLGFACCVGISLLLMQVANNTAKTETVSLKK